MINQSAAAWLRDVGSEVTVQVEPGWLGTEAVEQHSQGDRSVPHRSRSACARLETSQSLDQSAELVEPWLGQISAVKELPLPRLIAVQIDRDNPPDSATLRAALTSKFPTRRLDDHRAWQTADPARHRFARAVGVAIIASWRWRPSRSSFPPPAAPWRRTAKSSRCSISSARRSGSSRGSSNCTSWCSG